MKSSCSRKKLSLSHQSPQQDLSIWKWDFSKVRQTCMQVMMLPSMHPVSVDIQLKLLQWLCGLGSTGRHKRECRRPMGNVGSSPTVWSTTPWHRWHGAACIGARCECQNDNRWPVSHSQRDRKKAWHGHQHVPLHCPIWARQQRPRPLFVRCWWRRASWASRRIRR